MTVLSTVRPTVYDTVVKTTLPGLILGPEIVVNGGFDTGDLTGWTTQNAGAPNAVEVVNFEARLFAESGANTRLIQNGSLPAGGTYLVSVDVRQTLTVGTNILELRQDVTNIELPSGHNEVLASGRVANDLTFGRGLPVPPSLEAFIDNVSVRTIISGYASA